MAEIALVRGDTLKLTLTDIRLSDGTEYVLSDCVSITKWDTPNMWA